MRINLSSLTKDEVITWNARWSAGSKKSTKELLSDLQFCVSKKMESNLEISTHQLGHWLVKNGWTPTRGSGTERQWKKNQPSTETNDGRMAYANIDAPKQAADSSARHRMWYIDFGKERLKFSRLEVAKTIIFVDRSKSDPLVYWEFDTFIDVLNADNMKFHKTMWWNTHIPQYERMKAEFDLHPLSLLPFRKSWARKPDTSEKADTIEKTLMTTRGLLTMLLHWATNCSMTHQRRTAAKAMLNDILQTNISAIDDTHEMWSSFAAYIDEFKLTSMLTDAPASSKTKGKSMAKDASVCEVITNITMYLFANREKHADLLACLKKHLQMLETLVSDAVLKGKVGQETLENGKQSRKNKKDANKEMMQKSASNPISRHAALTDKFTKKNSASSRNDTSTKRMIKQERLSQNGEKQKSGKSKKAKLMKTVKEDI